MATKTYDLEFTATFRRRVEVDSEAEAQATLDAASIAEVYQNHEWNIDPYEFDKSLELIDDGEDEDEDAAEGDVA